MFTYEPTFKCLIDKITNFIIIFFSFYNYIKSNLIERNLLCFSETFGEFVLPPGVEDWKEIDPSKYAKVHVTSLSD